MHDIPFCNTLCVCMEGLGGHGRGSDSEEFALDRIHFTEAGKMPPVALELNAAPRRPPTRQLEMLK